MALSKYEQGIIDNVARHGWHCTIVGAGDDGEPGFAYTVGLWETRCTPELIVFGLEWELMHGMLSELVRQLGTGAQLSDGARWSNLLGGFDCITRPVHPTQRVPEYLNSALWYHGYRTGEEQVEVYQIFWPGAQQGLFPWERDCDAFVRDSQPQLYLPAGTGIA
jgi:hypothetical protein